MEVNFKIQNCGGIFELVTHVHVEVEKIYDKIIYLVVARFEDRYTLSIGKGFQTAEEAFEFEEKLAKKYPLFGDCRDYNIEYSPELNLKSIVVNRGK